MYIVYGTRISPPASVCVTTYEFCVYRMHTAIHILVHRCISISDARAAPVRATAPCMYVWMAAYLTNLMVASGRAREPYLPTYLRGTLPPSSFHTQRLSMAAGSGVR